MHISQSKYYQNLAEQLESKVKKLLVEITLLERLNRKTQKGIEPQRSYQPPDESYVDDQEAQGEKDKYEDDRKKYYNRRNQEEKDKAEENLARIAALDMNKMSASGRAQVAINKLKAERARERDKFDKDTIDQMSANDTRERFMTPEQKAARENRNKQVVAAMEKSAHEKMGHKQNAQGEWVDAQGKPASLAGTIDKFGPNVKIQGTNMTYGEFEKQTGRKYNAFSKEDSALVNKLAGAGRYSSEAARQGALTSDATNQAYRQQNDDMARRQGELDRKADVSQRELDRFRNNPQYREQLRKAEMEKVRPRVEAEQRAIDKGIARIKAQDDANFAQGVQNQIQQQFNQAKNQERSRESGPGKVGVPSLIGKPEQEPKALNSLSRPEGTPPEAPSLLQAPPPETPTGPIYTGVGSKDYGKAPTGIARPEDTAPDLLRRNSTTRIPVGTQIIKKSESMAAKPGPTATPATTATQTTTTSASPATTPPPASTGVQVSQKAAQMAAPANIEKTGGMNTPADLNDIETQEKSKPVPAGMQSSTDGTQYTPVPADQTPLAQKNNTQSTVSTPTPTATPPVALGSQVTAAANNMATPPTSTNQEEDEQQKGPLPAGQNATNVPIPAKKRQSNIPVGNLTR